MSLYQSEQDIIDSLTKDDIKKKLKDLGVEFHQAEGYPKLAKKLFEATGGDSVESSKPTSKKTKPEKDFFESLAKDVLGESKKIKASAPSKTSMFISKAHNFWMSPRSLNKKGKWQRFVEGLDTLDVGEQEHSGQVFKLNPVVFRGLDKPMFMGNFEGRGLLSTRNETLKDFIRNHKDFGSNFIEYNPEEIQRGQLEKDKKITLLKAGIYNADIDGLIRIVSYMDMKNGRNTFESLYNKSDKNELTTQAINYISNDPDNVLEALQSKIAKIVFMVNKAKTMGLIKVTSDGREVKRGDNGNTIIPVSMASDWQMEMVNFLTTAEGRIMFERLSDQTHVYFR